MHSLNPFPYDEESAKYVLTFYIVYFYDTIDRQPSKEPAYFIGIPSPEGSMASRKSEPAAAQVPAGCRRRYRREGWLAVSSFVTL